jgi:hypothetical protein
MPQMIALVFTVSSAFIVSLACAGLSTGYVKGPKQMTKPNPVPTLRRTRFPEPTDEELLRRIQQGVSTIETALAFIEQALHGISRESFTTRVASIRLRLNRGRLNEVDYLDMNCEHLYWTLRCFHEDATTKIERLIETVKMLDRDVQRELNKN